MISAVHGLRPVARAIAISSRTFANTGRIEARGGASADEICSASGNDDLVLFSLNKETKVATLTLNSPPTYNALTVEMGKAFENLVTSTLVPGLRTGEINANALVVTGAGDKAFSAGGDLEWLRSLRHNPVHINADLMSSFYRSFLCVRDLQIPVVAAINGPAIGAGACLATACDLRVASPKAKIGFTFASLGIHAGMGGSHFLPLAIGQAMANETLLTAKIFSGTEALSVGLFNRLSETNDADDVKKTATALAEEVASQHPLAVRSMTRSIRLREDEGLDVALRREAQAQALCYARGDWGEGIEANVERREPVFQDYFSK